MARVFLSLLAVLWLVGCDVSKPANPTAGTTTRPAATTFVANPVSPALADFASFLELKIYSDFSVATQKAQEMDAAISVFLYTPNETTLQAAQDAWRDAYDAFLHTFVYSHFPFPSPAEWKNQGISYQQTLYLLDAWPIEGGYVDFVNGYPFSGIVNDLTLSINADTLLKQHGFADPSYSSLGFHVLEFMLWGENGQRLPTDFSPQDNTAAVVNLETQAASLDKKNLVQNHHRRRQFLQLVSEQLQRHLQRLQARWEPSNGYYAKRLQASRPEHIAQASFQAIQQLISEELLHRRLDGNSSEFSKTTHEDIWALTTSIEQLLLPSQIVASNQEDWQNLFTQVRQCHKDCRTHFVEMLSLLSQTAQTLHIRLPDMN